MRGALTYKTDHTVSDITTIYQRLIITIHPTYGGFEKIQIPIASKEKTYDSKFVFDPTNAITAFSISIVIKKFLEGVFTTGSIHIGAISAIAAFFLLIPQSGNN